MLRQDILNTALCNDGFMEVVTESLFHITE